MRKLLVIIVFVLATFGMVKAVQNYSPKQEEGKAPLISIKTPQINSVVEHLKKQGLVVSDQQNSVEEQKFVDNFKKDVAATQKSVGIVPSVINTSSHSRKTLVVNDIALNIESYASVDSAAKAYEKNVAVQTRRRQDAENRKYQYNRTDYYLNGPFLMSIAHYKVELVNGKLSTKPRLLELDKNEIEKIVRAFQSSPINS
jgi:hypothetical protein